MCSILKVKHWYLADDFIQCDVQTSGSDRESNLIINCLQSGDVNYCNATPLNQKKMIETQFSYVSRPLWAVIIKILNTLHSMC